MKKTITTLVFILITVLTFAQIGEIKMYAGSNAPQGFVFCNGQLVTATDYPDYVDTVGAVYGGDGVTTAGIPDFRGRVPVGTGTNGEFSYVDPGQKFGTEFRTPYINTTATHQHLITYDKVLVDEGEDVEIWNIKGNTYAQPTMNTGASVKVNKHQPSLGINFIIRVTN
jgi:microcystin-dependent protein